MHLCGGKDRRGGVDMILETAEGSGDISVSGLRQICSFL